MKTGIIGLAAICYFLSVSAYSIPQPDKITVCKKNSHLTQYVWHKQF